MKVLLLSLLTLTSVISEEAQPKFRRQVTRQEPKSYAQYFSELPCFHETNFYDSIDNVRFNDEVMQAVFDGIPQEQTDNSFDYPLENSNVVLRFHFWRTGQNVFAKTEISSDDKKSWTAKQNLVWYNNDTEMCFRVIPNGCVHEEVTQDTYIDICEGYEMSHLNIQKGLMEIAVENKFDPEVASK